MATWVLCAVVGLGVGWVIWRRLGSLSYRYAEERPLPAPRLAWVVPGTAIAWGLVGARFGTGSTVLLGLYLLAGAAFVVLAAIDLDVRRLPDAITVPAVPVVASLLGVVALGDGSAAVWLRAVLAAAGLGLVYVVSAVLSPSGALGGGDVKLAPTLGLLLGYLGWSHVVVGTLLAFVTAGAWAAYLLVVRGAGRKATLALGPHLLLGAFLAVVAPVFLSGASP